MTSTAIDIEAPGVDNVTGSGIVMATNAVNVVMGPGTVQFSAPTYSIGEAGPSATITVNRVGGSAGAASVQVAVVAGGTATGGGTDFTYGSPQTVSWAAGESAAKTVSVAITQDPTDEPDETVNLALQSPTTVTLGSPSTATLTVVDDDLPPSPGSVQFSASTSSIGEAGTSATITVNRVGGSAGAGSVDVAVVAGGSATGGGTDFTYVSPQTVSWVDGDAAPKTVSVAITSDGAAEGNETINLALQSPSTVTLGSPATAVLTVVDDDGPPPVPGSVQFNVSANSIGEAAGTATLTINRVGGSGGAGTVQVARTGGTATSGTDFTFTSPVTVNFADGQTTATATVSIVNDTTAEMTAETIVFALQSPTGGIGLGSPATHTLSIADNDFTGSGLRGIVQFGVATASIAENGSSALVQLTRAGGNGPGSVQVVLTGVTATPGSDFTFASPVTVAFSNFQTIANVTVPIVDDTLVETAETVQLTLQNPGGGLALGTNSAHTLTITDNDAASAGQVSFSASTSSVGEAGPSATITVNRVGGSAGAASVQVAVVAGGTATGGGTDFTYSSPQTVSWADGDSAPKAVSVAITQDPTDEPDETVELALQNPTTVTLGSPSAAMLTIVDDDGSSPATGAVQFSVATSSTSEGAGTAVLTIDRVGGSTGAGTVQVARTGGTATASDFTFVSPQTVNFANAQTTATVSFPIINDTTPEQTETVLFALQNPTDGLTLGSPTSHTRAIVDNDKTTGGAVLRF